MSHKYAVFETAWGFFALATTDGRLSRVILPCRAATQATEWVREDLPGATSEKNLLPTLQSRIIAYFEGRSGDFEPLPPLALDRLTPFTRHILQACMTVRLGQTNTYAELAIKADHPKAARAVGNALARNPIPLIIPCHRIITSTGRLGGFSAPGGPSLKERLLEHEQQFRP